MRKIVFYISGLGFGHLTRSMAVVQELIRREDTHVTVKCHSAHMPLVLTSFSDKLNKVDVLPFTLGFQVCFDEETGKIDFKKTMQSVDNWLAGLEAGAEAEMKTCLNKGYSLVVSDIAPEAFFVAEKLGIPSVGISNFTWYEFLKEYVGEQKLVGLKVMYQKTSCFLEYPLSTGDDIPIAARQTVGLVTRSQDIEKIAQLRQRYKRPGRLLLFLSVGGALSLRNAELSPNVDYLYTRGIHVTPSENTSPVPPESVDTQNYLAACDGVITKCGWSTVSEALIARKPIFLLRTGGGGKEERCMLQELAELGVSEVIDSKERLCLGHGQFDNIDCLMQAYDRIPERYTDQTGKIAEILLANT